MMWWRMWIANSKCLFSYFNDDEYLFFYLHFVSIRSRQNIFIWFLPKLHRVKLKSGRIKRGSQKIGRFLVHHSFSSCFHQNYGFCGIHCSRCNSHKNSWFKRNKNKINKLRAAVSLLKLFVFFLPFTLLCWLNQFGSCFIFHFILTSIHCTCMFISQPNLLYVWLFCSIVACIVHYLLSSCYPLISIVCVCVF